MFDKDTGKVFQEQPGNILPRYFHLSAKGYDSCSNAITAAIGKPVKSSSRRRLRDVNRHLIVRL